MKRLLFSFVMLIAAVGAWAQYVEQDGLWFSLHDTNPKYAQVEEPESGSYSGEITIPSVVSYGGEDYPVTCIGWSAFKESAVTKVTIPSSVTEILGSAFQGCASLTEVNLSEGLEDISSYVFQGSAVTSLTIPGTVTRIQTSAMEAMTSLTKLTFAYGLRSWRWIGLFSTAPTTSKSWSSTAITGMVTIKASVPTASRRSPSANISPRYQRMPVSKCR